MAIKPAKGKAHRGGHKLATALGVASLALWYGYAAASDPDKTPYDLSFWRMGASVVGTVMSLRHIRRGSPAAVPLAAATAVGTVTLGAVNVLKKGAYVTRTWDKTSVKETIFNRAMPVVHAVGAAALVGASLLAAKKSKGDAAEEIHVADASAPDMVDVRPVQTEVEVACGGDEVIARQPQSAVDERNALIVAEEHPVRAKIEQAIPILPADWYPRARKLGLYFMTFSILGHWVEMAFCTGIKHGIFKGGYDRNNHMLWDQWLFPFPAEGTAGALAELLLRPARNAIVRSVDASPVPQSLNKVVATAASFLANQLICTSVDFGTGMIANRDYQLWDYRDMRFHFMGQVCLQNSLFYSIIATWGVNQLLPALDKLMDRMGDEKLDGALVGLGSFYLMLCALYFVVDPRKIKQ